LRENRSLYKSNTPQDWRKYIYIHDKYSCVTLRKFVPCLRMVSDERQGERVLARALSSHPLPLQAHINTEQTTAWCQKPEFINRIVLTKLQHSALYNHLYTIILFHCCQSYLSGRNVFMYLGNTLEINVCAETYVPFLIAMCCCRLFHYMRFRVCENQIKQRKLKLSKR
jgi:hypothetical protein